MPDNVDGAESSGDSPGLPRRGRQPSQKAAVSVDTPRIPADDSADENETPSLPSTITAPAPETDFHTQASRGRGRGRLGYARHDLSTGSVPKHIARLAWPQVIEGVLNVADQMVDLIWAGRLPGGYRSLAGVGVGQSFTQFGMMARQGLDQSMRAMVSRAVGAGDIALANHVALQAFTLSGIYSLLMVIVGLFLTDVLLNVIGTSEAVHAETALYMRVQFVGMATMAFRMMSGAALQASGDVMAPLKATTVTRLLHIVLTPFLMFGWWGFPSIGLAGAALANVVAQLAGCAVNFYALFNGSSRLHLTLRNYRVDYPLLWRMLKLGAPASIAGTERATAQLVLLKFVAPFGDIAIAAYALTRRMEMFSNFSSMGMGQAAGIMVGQNLGANRPDRAKQSVWWALSYVTVLKVIIGTLFFLFPAAFVMLFTSDVEAVELATTWIRIQVFAAIFMSIAMVFQQSFNNAGDTMAPMMVTLLAVWFLEIPIAWTLIHYTDLGVLAIGFAAIAGMGGRVLFYVPYFFTGRWLRIKVI